MCIYIDILIFPKQTGNRRRRSYLSTIDLTRNARHAKLFKLKGSC